MKNKEKAQPTNLSKVAIERIMLEKLPQGVKIDKDVLDLVQKMGFEFIQMVSSEANELGKGVITPNHILQALERLELNIDIDEVKATFDQYKILRKEEKEKELARELEMTEEEAATKQRKMFDESRARMKPESVYNSLKDVIDSPGKEEGKYKKRKNRGTGSG